MPRLPNAVSAWDTPSFTTTLKQEIEALDGKSLPLQQGLTHSSYANEDQFSVVILKAFVDDANAIHVKAGIFYSGLIPGCSCADDPSPDNEYSEYCEVGFTIDRTTAEIDIRLLPE